MAEAAQDGYTVEPVRAASSEPTFSAALSVWKGSQQAGT